jgi:DNA replication and repair protein RecF
LTALLTFDQITVQGVRNLKPATYEFSRSVNILIGGNGQGKTSVLEALSIVATGRSFRTEQLREVVQNGQESLAVTARLVEEGFSRQQRLVLAANKRQGHIDGKRVARLAEYATHSPIVVFHPSDLDLVTGPASTRRNLLARIALYSDASTQDTRLAYARALRHRQLLLERGQFDDRSLLAFESLIAEHGYQLACIHAQAAARLAQALANVFEELSANVLSLQTQFDATDVSGTDDYRRKLRDLRTKDRQRGRANFGPHRDDLQLLLDGMTARQHASQGQQRLLALAVKLAELHCIRAVRGVHPVLLLDDVVSELDRNRTVSVFDWLKTADSQIFISAPREDVIRSREFPEKESRIFVVEQGELRLQ